MRTLAILAALALTVTASCARGDEGALEAQAAPGVTIGRRTIPGDTAEIVRDRLHVRLWGDWGRDAGETIDIAYRNTSGAPVTIAVDRIRVAFAGRPGTIEQITDITGVDLTDTDERNDIGRSLLGGADDRRPAVLLVPRGAERQVSVRFLPFSDGARPSTGDMLTFDVPLASGSVAVPMRCGGP